MGQEDHKLAAIVFTDIVGYTKQMEENELRTMQLLQQQREIIFPLVKSFGGEVIKEIGDGLMMMFGSAVEAVRFAIAAQNRLKDEELTIRAGIHIGDVIFRDGDVFGSAVNTAARIEPLAPPNGICISEDVHSQLQNKSDIETIPLGKKELKGVKSAVGIYEVYIDGITQREQRNLAFIIKDLWKRAVIQIVIGYLASAWIIRLAVTSIVDSYLLSPYLVDLTWVILISLLPTVFLFSYYHGKRKTSRWTRAEQIGFPANLILTGILSFILFQGKDLGAATTTLTVENEAGETIQRTILKSEFRKKLVVFFFDNKTGDSTLQWLQYGFPTTIVYDISQDLLVDATSSLQYLDKLRDAGFSDGLNSPLMLKKEIADYYHRNYFTTGSFDFKNNTWLVNLNLYDTKKGTLVTTLNYENSDIFALTDQLTVDLKKALGMADQQIESATDLPLEAIFTKSFEAFEYYIKSLMEIKFNNNWPKSLEYSQKAIDIDDNFAIAYLTIAEFYFNSNMPDKAKEALQITMDKRYNLPERNQFYAKFFYYLADQKADEANAVMKMWTELYPDDINAKVSLAQRYLMKNDMDAAIKQYKIILKLVPDEYEYVKLLGDIYEMAGKYDSSLLYYEKYAKKYPNDFASFKNIGDSYRNLAEFDKARVNYDKALIIEPWKMSAIAALANIDLREGKFEQAKTRIDEALQKCKTPMDSITIMQVYEDYYLVKGEALTSFDYSQQLFKIYDRIMPPLRQKVFRVFFIGKFLDAGKEEEALQLLKKTESEFKPPFDKVAAFGYLFYYTEVGDADKAASYVDDAIALMEGFGEQTLYPNILGAEGKIAEINGDYQKAVEKYQQYYQLKKTDIAVYRWLSRSYRELGDYKQAAEEIDKALKFNPFNAKNNYEAGMLELARGKKEKAREYLIIANEIWGNADPGYKPAQKAKAALAELQAI